MGRRLIIPAVTAIAVAAAYGWASLVGYLWTDYELANEAPLRALVAGDWHAFLQDSPIEGPSLLLRAPFALAVNLWGGGDLAIYRMVAVPGLLAGAALGLALHELRRRRFPEARWPILVLLLAAGNPIALRMLEQGHPEELLGAAMCVGAVLAALHRRPWLAAVLLGLALANKAWAVLAIGPVLVALESRRWAVLGLSGAIAAAFVAPFLLAGEEARAAVVSAGQTYTVFQPWQAWWFLGEHGHEIRGFFGAAKEGYRAAPEWIGPVSHPLIAFLVLPASLLWWRLRGLGRGTPDVLLLLALLFLARCVLDVANNGYYHLPFLLSLLAWETLRGPRPPVWSLLGAALVWLTVERLQGLVAPDLQAVAYLLWTVPALVVLARLAYAPPAARERPAAALVPATA